MIYSLIPRVYGHACGSMLALLDVDTPMDAFVRSPPRLRNTRSRDWLDIQT